MKHAHFAMLYALETYCRARCYCWASNAGLAEKLGLSTSQVKRLLKEMEALGYVYRLSINPDRPTDGRAGIFLHRRLDPDLPVADKPPTIDDVRRLWEARERAGDWPCPSGPAPAPGASMRHPLAQGCATPLAQECATNNDEGANKDEKNDDTRPVVIVVVEFPSIQGPELAALVARAEERFGANRQRVEQAVKAFGLEWVEQALERPGTKQWGGVLHTLGEYKAEGGPCAKVIKKALATPLYDQWTLPNETPAEKAERHRKALLALEQPATEVVTAPVEGGEFTAMWQAARRAPS
jgi:hypothetical protein